MSSSADENLTYIVVLEPHYFPADVQFLLSQTRTLSITDMLARYDINTRIKGPNDIYVADSKIVGILIENDISGGKISRSIAGIGLNVNQTAFPEHLPNPVSMSLLAGREFDLTGVLGTFIDCLNDRYKLLSFGDAETLDDNFHELLYRRNSEARYRLPDGTVFEGIVRGVGHGGELFVEHPSGDVESYLLKEIEFVI